MTREEALKHPDYVYAPFVQELQGAHGEVERAMKRFIDSAGQYAEKKYNLPLSTMLIEKHAEINFNVFKLPEGGQLFYAELTNEEWFDKEVMNEQ